MAKNKIISFKIEGETKEAFEKICKDDFTTVSQSLYSHVHKKIKARKGSSKSKRS